MNFNSHLIGIEMWIFDEEPAFYTGLNGQRRLSENAALSNQTNRTFRNEPYYGMYQSDPRPTKAEAKKQLDILSVPFRLGAPFAPPLVKPVLVGAPRLAEILIDIDPQDRFRN
jgi:hypothetical protein